MKKCLRCGRPLKNVGSQKIGYGQFCFKRMKKEHKRQTELTEYDV